MRANTHLICQRTFAILDGCRDALPDQVPGEVSVLAWIGACLSVAPIGNGGLMIATRDAHLRFQNWALSGCFKVGKSPAIDGLFQSVQARLAGSRHRRASAGWHYLGITVSQE